MINPACEMTGRMVKKAGPSAKVTQLFMDLLNPESSVSLGVTRVPMGRSSCSRQMHTHPHTKVQNTHPGEEVMLTLHYALRKQCVGHKVNSLAPEKDSLNSNCGVFP